MQFGLRVCLVPLGLPLIPGCCLSGRRRFPRSQPPGASSGRKEVSGSQKQRLLSGLGTCSGIHLPGPPSHQEEEGSLQPTGNEEASGAGPPLAMRSLLPEMLAAQVSLGRGGSGSLRPIGEGQRYSWLLIVIRDPHPWREGLKLLCFHVVPSVVGSPTHQLPSFHCLEFSFGWLFQSLSLRHFQSL